MKPQFKKRSEETTQQHRAWLAQHRDFSVVLLGTSMLERFQWEEGAKTAYEESGLNKISVFNCGVGGDKIANILFRIETLKILQDIQCTPELVIVEVGANDMDRKNVDLDALVQGVAQIVAHLRSKFPAERTHIAFVALYPQRCKEVTEPVGIGRVAQFNEKLQKFAETQSNSSFYDWGADVLDQNMPRINNRYFVDNVHFSRYGYSLFAAHLADVIKQYVH
jgi:lysophospholipase L1-like esterase